MKKNFTLFLAMGLAATAMAGGRQSLSGLTLKAPVKKIQATELAFPAGKALKAPAYAATFDTLDQFEGTMTWSFANLLSDSEYLETMPTDVFVVDDEIGEIGIEILPQAQGFELVKGYVDFEAGTVSIPNVQKLGSDEYGDIYFYIKDVNLTTGYINEGAADVQNTVGDIIDNTIVFPEYDIWATGDPTAEQYGYFTVTAYNTFTFELGGDNGEETDPDWENYAKGNFVDGWAIPAMDGNYDQYQFPWEVTIQRNVTDHNLIRLVHPYNVETCPFYGNHQGKGGYIVIDLNDPDYVLVCPGYSSGFNPDGTMDLYFFNIEGFYTSMGITKEQVLTNTTLDLTPSTFDGTTIELRNLFFNMPGMTDQAYNWTGKADQMHGRVTITGYLENSAIESVEVESAATQTIYDLSGRRLNTITAPGLYIVNGQKVIK